MNKGLNIQITESDVGFDEYAFKKRFSIDKNAHKKVLIVGSKSYVGNSFSNYVSSVYPNIETVTISLRDDNWKNISFAGYDSVFHVVGIAHADVRKLSEKDQQRYYDINTSLAIETAKKAKNDGVKQFVFMSSMIVYGDSIFGKKDAIDEKTLPSPCNFYGDSKWQADIGIRKLSDENFKVAVIRSPMIYGKGSKNNYSSLVRISKKTPMIPDINNCRSMIFVEDFCEFISQIVLSGEGGIYFPQNSEYVKTSDMVSIIGKIIGKPVKLVKIFNHAVCVASKCPGRIGSLVNKAFGNSFYSQVLSTYDGIDYQRHTLEESIAISEGGGSVKRSNNKVLILVNHDITVYSFRLEIVQRLLKEGYEVHISSPFGEYIGELIKIGAKCHEITINRHGMNPFDEIKILSIYRKLIKEIKPAIILTYTIKCNAYGGIAARMAKIPYVPNITGLGTTITGSKAMEKLILQLCRIGFKKAQVVFFQNESNKDFMLERKVLKTDYKVLPGSGVNLEKHCLEEYPDEENGLVFSTIGRIMKDKGADELLEAVKIIKQKHPECKFRVIGFFDDDYEDKVRNAANEGLIEYIEQQKNIHPWIKESHAIIHPSYHEGMSNVLLEAAATGRPIIASDIPGCRETFDEGVSGIGFEPQSSTSLVEAIEKFISIPNEEKRRMGLAGRKKMEEEFNREIVVDYYLNEVKRAAQNEK